MDIDIFLRNIFGQKQISKKESPQWTLPIAHGKIVSIEVKQQEQQIYGNPELENAGKGATKLALRLTKEPNDAFVNERRFVDWVNLEGSACTRRIPRPCIRRYSLRNGFRIGKVEYRSFSELRAEILDQENISTRMFMAIFLRRLKSGFPVLIPSISQMKIDTIIGYILLRMDNYSLFIARMKMRRLV